MELPHKKEINKDPEWHALAMLWVSLEKLDRIKKKVAEKIADLLAYQWETWSDKIGRNKRTRLRQNLYSIARTVLERMKWRKWEEIARNEIEEFLWIKI